jgi:hypothetical protein
LNCRDISGSVKRTLPIIESSFHEGLCGTASLSASRERITRNVPPRNMSWRSKVMPTIQSLSRFVDLVKIVRSDDQSVDDQPDTPKPGDADAALGAAFTRI